MRQLRLVGTAVLMAFATDAGATVWLCKRTGEERKRDSRVVFTGRVKQVVRDGSYWRAEFNVERVWTGTEPDRVTMYERAGSPGYCDATFEFGASYLVYARWFLNGEGGDGSDRLQLLTNPCDRDRLGGVAERRADERFCGPMMAAQLARTSASRRGRGNKCCRAGGYSRQGAATSCRLGRFAAQRHCVALRSWYVRWER
jgi:hypothetical protein